MKKIITLAASAAIAILLSTPCVHAQDVAIIKPGDANTPVTRHNMPAYLDEDLASKHADFTAFAKGELKSLDRNHIMSKERMTIVRLSDGRYQGQYRAADHSSIVCTVKRSQSASSPYVAVLRYYEILYVAEDISPSAVRRAPFRPAKKKRVFKIYKHDGNRWQ